jgi:hypothetical protein
MTDADFIAILLIVRASISLLPGLRLRSQRLVLARRLRRSLQLAVRRELGMEPASARPGRTTPRVAALRVGPPADQARVAA